MHSGPGEEDPHPIPEPAGLSNADNVPGATEELVQVLSMASVAYTYSHEDPVGLFLGPAFQFNDEKKNCLITLLRPSGAAAEGQEQGKITIAVDSYESGYEARMGSFEVCCQLDSGTVPIMLLSLGLGECAGSETEAELSHFDDVKKALGLTQTGSAQLLVMLMSRAMPLDDVREMVSEVMGEYSSRPTREKMPVLHAVFEILA